MTRSDDDVFQRDDELDDLPLVRALRAPGTTAELADQAAYLAVYRARSSRGSFGRLAGRFGVGATAVVTSIALSGGVAAAYTRSLPEPMQKFAHDVLGPVGVPAAPPERPRATAPTPSPAATPSSSPAPTRAPAGAPTDGPTLPAPTPGPTATATPSASVTTAPVTSVAPSPTPTPTRAPGRVATDLSASVPDRTVPVGTSVTVSGVLTSGDGTPLRNRTVRLAGRSTGEQWARLVVGKTDADGRVSLQSPALTRSTSLRLSTPRKLRSRVVRVVVVPALDASTQVNGATTTITVSAQGGRAGDTVAAYRRQGEKLVKIGTAVLDESGTAAIGLPTPKRPVRIVLRLRATDQHGRGQTAVTVGPAVPNVRGETDSSDVPEQQPGQ